MAEFPENPEKVSKEWLHKTEVSGFSSELEGYLKRYQKPEEADALTKLQTNLHETKIILLDTIQELLKRRENLDDMVERSTNLTKASKKFYTVARKTNSCCGSWT